MNESEIKLECRYCGYITERDKVKLPFADKIGRCPKCNRNQWGYHVDTGDKKC